MSTSTCCSTGHAQRRRACCTEPYSADRLQCCHQRTCNSIHVELYSQKCEAKDKVAAFNDVYDVIIVVLGITKDAKTPSKSRAATKIHIHFYLRPRYQLLTSSLLQYSPRPRPQRQTLGHQWPTELPQWLLRLQSPRPLLFQYRSSCGIKCRPVSEIFVEIGVLCHS